MLRSVLIIGSNQAMNQLILTVLHNLYEPIIVEDVFHGMYQIRRKKEIHTIIIDIDFQIKESADFIQHINTSKLYHKPMLVLVSKANEKASAPLLESCAYRCFVKPFNPIELVKSINGIDSLKPSTFLS